MTTFSFTTRPLPYYIFSLFVLLASHHCLASNQKPTIKGFNETKLKVANSLAKPNIVETSFKDKVRIGLRLTMYEPVSHQVSGSSMKVSRVLRHTLRAKVLTPNHFYIDNLHVQTTPIKWNRINGNYGVKISFFSKYGNGGEVEEELGSLIVRGNLKGKDGLFILHGLGKATFKDKFSKPKLSVVAGYNPMRPKDKLAKRSLIKGNLRPHDFRGPQKN
ncbi:MAG: hypothetical protein HRU09_13645 [Oligoflexales bacterium]|nr:hypothetical protein [Oligoflexales bacterium]